MSTDITIQDRMDLTEFVPDAIHDETKRILKLYWILDNWLDDVDSPTLQENHTQVLRSQLDRLIHYYAERGQRNKAKLAVTLYGAARYAVQEPLTHTQIHAIQNLLPYFQQASVTLDDLKQSHQTLLHHQIYTLPEMPNWQTAIADH